MARVLIVGWDADAPALARELHERGHLVRGTAPDDAGLARIEAAGAEGGGADPDRLGTLLPHLQGGSAVWCLAGASPRPEPLAETLVDTHVRGLVCEPGPGAEAARRVATASNVRLEIVADREDLAAALDRVLSI